MIAAGVCFIHLSPAVHSITSLLLSEWLLHLTTLDELFRHNGDRICCVRMREGLIPPGAVAIVVCSEENTQPRTNNQTNPL